MVGCNRLIDGAAAHANAYQRRHAGLLHRHAVDRVGSFRSRARIVRDDDELRVVLESVEHAYKVADVLIVERRVHLVKQTEGTGLGEKYSKEQGQGNQRLLSAREKMDSLRPLAT